jgi:hypothetical protein
MNFTINYRPLTEAREYFNFVLKKFFRTKFKMPG